MKKIYILTGWIWLLALSAVRAQSNAPSGLSGSAAAYNQINLTWKDNSTNETKFEIERNDFTSFTKIGEVGANTTSYQDKTVQGGGSYTYRVRAILVTGAATTYSNEITVKTPQEPPGTPTGLSVTVQGSSIQLAWSNGGGRVADNYRIERASAPGGPFLLYQTVAYSRTPSFIDNGVSPGQQYCYQIRSQNSGGNSAFTSPQCATLPLAATNVKNFKATALSSNSIKLTWDRYGKESAITIERRTGQTGDWARLASTLADNGEYTDNSVNGGTEYCYRILEDGHVNSDVACATTPQSVPTAPARMQAQTVAYNQINLQWADLSNNETGFQIERAEGGPTAAYTKIADVGANTTSYNDQGVEGSKQYCYRVRAVNSVGASAYIDPPACATTPAPPVGVPQNLVATAVSTTQINLTWQAVAGANGYQLERSPNGSDNWQKIADPAANATSYSDNNLSPNTRYYYRIRALNAAGAPSDYSNVVNAITPDAPPVAPARLTVTATTYNQVSLQWADLSGNESGFQIERSPDGAKWDKITDLPANTTTYTDQTVAPRTRYYYRVRAVNAAGPSDYSNVVDVTTPDGPPAVPTRLTATASSATSIYLTWTDASDNETGFEVERSPDGVTWTKIADIPANATSYTNTGLTSNTRYFYRIRAVNAVGQSAYSNTADATTPDVPPIAPARLTATAVSVSQVNLQWADLSNNENGFEVEQGNSATGTFTKIADLSANTTTYESKALTDNTTYCYRVRAKNAAGTSAYTEVVCATTPLAPPAAPVNLTAQIVDYDQVKLNWSPLSANATTLVIERSTSPNGPFQEIKQQPAAQTTYTDAGLQEFTTYYYRVRAVNTAGNSGYSNVASAQVKEILIAVEDELETHTTLYVSHRTLHVTTNWVTAMRTTLRLLTVTGRDVLIDNRKVNPTDGWSYNLDRLASGSYIVHIIADGRKLSKRIILP